MVDQLNIKPLKQIKLFSPRIITNLLFVFALMIIIIINIFSVIQVSRFVTANQLVVHTYRVIQSTNNIFLNLLQIESAVRGYLITSNSILLQEINDKKHVMYENYKEAKELTLDNISQQKSIAILYPLLVKRMDFIDRTIKSITENRQLQANLVTQGHNLTKTIAAEVNTITSEEFALLQQRNISAISNLNELNHFLLAASIISVILFSLGIIIINFNLSRQEQFLQEKRRMENLITSLIVGTNDIIVALDLNYRFIIFNGSFEKEFKHLFNKRPVIGASIIELLSHLPEEQKKVSELWERALSGEEFSMIGEFGSNSKNKADYECNFNSIYDENGVLMGAAAICRNIENRIETENFLKAFNEKLENAYQELKQHDTEVSLLNEMENTLQSCDTFEETLPIINMYCQKLLPFSAGAIYLINSSRNYLEAVVEWNSPNITEKVFSPNQCWALRQGKKYVYINDRTNVICDHADKHNFFSYLCIPLFAQNEIIGLIQIILLTTQNFTENEVSEFVNQHDLLFKNISTQLALAIGNIQLRESLKNRAIRDPLTGLYNRAYLGEFLERDLHRARRKNIPVTIVMMDLDHFKEINDKYGHDAGDLVLKEFGKLLQEKLRGSDTTCRYGGEEFLIILYEANLENAYKLIETLRKQISQMEIIMRGTVLDKITASFGLAEFPTHGDNPADLITAADEALFQSKKNGRNQTTIYQPS